MRNLKTLIVTAGIILIVGSRAFAIKIVLDGVLDDDQATQLHHIARKMKPKPHVPAPPPPPPVLCPTNAQPVVNGIVSWDDLKSNFEGNFVTGKQEIIDAFRGTWIKVGEARHWNQPGAYDPQGLNVPPICHRDWDIWSDRLQTHCYGGVPRSGWIGMYQTTDGPLGSMNFGVQIVSSFNDQQRVTGMGDSFIARFDRSQKRAEEGPGLFYIMREHEGEHDGFPGMRREIRIIRPNDPRQKPFTAVMRESLSEQPDTHAYFQYCKVSD